MVAVDRCRVEARSGFNPCCCWNVKDGSVAIAVWSLIYGIIQISLFGWQMVAIKYEKDRAANTLLPNYNTYGRFDIPSYYESYWQSPEERYYTGLFVIQIFCLGAAFLVFCASLALLYGVHTYSGCLIWPWLPCMCASILGSWAYCIMWWSGDVRDYWIVLTAVEFFPVFINIYCMVVVVMFYRHLVEERRDREKRLNEAVPLQTSLPLEPPPYSLNDPNPASDEAVGDVNVNM